MKKIPEGKEKKYWERAGGIIPKPHRGLGTAAILHNQSREMLGNTAIGLSTQKSNCLGPPKDHFAFIRSHLIKVNCRFGKNEHFPHNSIPQQGLNSQQDKTYNV